MSIRDELTKLIAQHGAPGWDTWTDKNGQNHTIWTCICGWSHRQEGWDAAVANQHLADVILARYALVERPTYTPAVNRATVTSMGWVKPYNWMANGGLLSPQAAREAAIDLISAANRAEATDVDR